MTSDGMHPAYFETRFEVDDSDASWPTEFVILSAHAATGETWTPFENEQAHFELEKSLRGVGVWVRSITGYSPGTGHAELSWATVLPLDEARLLGRRFRQDAIFHVRGNQLSVTRCRAGSPLVPVGGFRERLDGVAREGGFGRVVDDANPWPRLSAASFRERIDARLVDDEQATAEDVLVFRPRDAFTLGDVILEGAWSPDDMAPLVPDVESDYWSMHDLADRLPWIEGVGTVIECSVTDSTVSSMWGLGEFAIGDRGYVYHITDYEGFDHGTPQVLGAWEPKDDPAARLECVTSCYARDWDRIGLPPLLGQWVSGNPELLIASLLRVLGGSRAAWDGIVDTILSTEWLDFRNRVGLDTVSKHFGIPYARLSRAAWSVEASTFLPRVVSAEATQAEREAAAALYLGCITWALEPAPDRSQWLGPVKELCGSWHIGYASDEGMIEEEGPFEQVDLRPDGSFSWEPEPAWLAGSGAWGVEVTPNGEPKLCLDTETGDRRCHYMVLHDLPDVGMFFHLQRTRADAVVFKDRILRGSRMLPDSRTTHTEAEQGHGT